MQCFHCKSTQVVVHARNRYKCNGCGRTFVAHINSPFYRHRFPGQVIKAAILWHLYVPSFAVQIFVLVLFFRWVSRNTICAWSRKFSDSLPSFMPPFLLQEEKSADLFADDKFISAKGRRAYWWSVWNSRSELIAVLASLRRDLPSAKLVLARAKKALLLAGQKARCVVSDKLQAYIKAKNLLGRKCRHVQTGIKGKIVQLEKDKIDFITNNIAESGNARIEKYLAKFNYSFASIEAAERAARQFMLTEYLKCAVAAWRSGIGPPKENVLNKTKMLEFSPILG